MLLRFFVLALIFMVMGCTPQETLQRETPQRASQPITRTVEGFTLGMDEDQASSVFMSGIKNGSFTRLESAILTKGVMPTEWGVSKPKMISAVDRSQEMKTGFEWEELDGKSSVLFSSSTMQAIELSFFHSKLFAINLVPRADYDVVKKALQEKYGPPHSEKIWVDPLTTLTLAKHNRDLVVRYHHVGDIRLIYVDRNLDNLREEYSKTQQRQREEKKQRIRSTLPKNY